MVPQETEYTGYTKANNYPQHKYNARMREVVRAPLYTMQQSDL
jgi:hypothetical protein